MGRALFFVRPGPSGPAVAKRDGDAYPPTERCVAKRRHVYELETVQTMPVPAGDGGELSSFEAEVIRLVNEERAEYGLPALTTTDALTAAAAKRAEEISGDYGHDRPDGSSCFTVLPEFGIRYETAGENIAAGQKTPAQVVRAWMNSEGHRNNILNPDFTQIGVGYTYTGRGYRHFWAQTFIG